MVLVTVELVPEWVWIPWESCHGVPDPPVWWDAFVEQHGAGCAAGDARCCDGDGLSTAALLPSSLVAVPSTSLCADFGWTAGTVLIS